MSRITATVLFTDLVGSTELRGRLGEETADELRRRHDQLLAKAVEANHGSVVKGLGDGVMATFAGAADAVAAAVAIQQAVDRLNRSGKAPVPISVRIGLSAGDVGFEDDDVHGTPVIEAARLCAAAGGDEILLSESVRLLAGLADEDQVDRGRLELKGLKKPVTTWQLRWEPVAVSTVPMPALLTDIGRIFVGRDTELERLSQLWKEVVAGERRLALVAGEPGVGKTRLAAELALRTHDEGAFVLAGRCDEDLGVPYQPFVEALRHFVDGTPVSELSERLGRYGGELARLVPELSDREPQLGAPLRSDSETERYRLFDAVAAWLSAASAVEPILLVLDDLQWATKPTLLLLRHVARSAEPIRLLVLGTYRDTEIGHDHPLAEVVADLRRLGGMERISLLGLDPSGVVAYIEAAAGRSLSDEDRDFARAVYEETEGNLFFVREIFRHLTETGAIRRTGGRWQPRLPVEELGIPESVRDVVGRRVGRLSEETKGVLRLAAVSGAEFDLSVVQAASGLDEEAVLRALEEAMEARLLIGTTQAVSRYRFTHALVRDTLYGDLSPPRRVSLHRRVAETIEAIRVDDLDDYLPALAYHWARASAPAAETTKAIEYAARAGDRALAQLAHDEGVAYYQQALELLDTGTAPVDEHRRLPLLLALGVAQRRAGVAAHRATLLQAAQLAIRLGDAPRLAEAALANARGMWSYTLGVDSERVGVLEAALDAFPTGDSPTRARLLAVLGQELIFEHSGGRHYQLSAEGVAMARRLADRTALADTLAARTAAIFADPSFADEWLADTAELQSLATDLDDPSLRAFAACFRFGAAFQAGSIDEADRALEEQERAAAEAGQPMIHWLGLLCRTGRLLAAGRIGDAETSMNEALELGLATGQPDARQFHASTRFEMLFEIGRLHEDLDRLVEAVGTSGRAVVRAMLALTYSELGQGEEARALLEPLVRELPGLPRSGGPWIRTLVPVSLACSRLGDRRLVEGVVELLVPYTRLITGTEVAWSAAGAHHLGMLAASLGQLDKADRFFADAHTTHASVPAPAWLARTRLEWARMLVSRRDPGDTDRARGLLGQTLETARELGLRKVEQDTVGLLQDWDS
jgi:class 3 adenylate cyclase/tetratricopeptide (TPR) repeat protein